MYVAKGKPASTKETALRVGFSEKEASEVAAFAKRVVRRVKLCGYCGKPVLYADAQMEWTVTRLPRRPKVSWHLETCVQADQEVWPNGVGTNAKDMLAIVEKRSADRVRCRL